ncbi:MAG: thermonuclease family protein, partial [Candidatus Aenigmarchaeota archaeon]|nr:thermonuclease family protein [Candidatus Aenigmarchaeota archaeon]
MKLNKRYKIVLISLIIVVVLIGSYFVTKSLFVRTKAEVSYVIDGDTIVLKNKQRVRLIGMNAPEIGDFYANDAKKYLCGLVCNKTIILESDKIDRDQYGRLLRYVWIG